MQDNYVYTDLHCEVKCRCTKKVTEHCINNDWCPVSHLVSTEPQRPHEITRMVHFSPFIQNLLCCLCNAYIWHGLTNIIFTGSTDIIHKRACSFLLNILLRLQQSQNHLQVAIACQQSKLFPIEKYSFGPWPWKIDYSRIYSAWQTKKPQNSRNDFTGSWKSIWRLMSIKTRTNVSRWDELWIWWQCECSSKICQTQVWRKPTN